jgi:DNA-binding NarL/FixJ family response regulator
MTVALTRLLSLECDIVGHARTAAELLTEATTHGPDVVVVDLYLADENGIEACRQLKSANPDVKIVMVTAEDDSHIRSAALNAGASDFVPKSMAHVQLVPAILRLCSRSAD